MSNEEIIIDDPNCFSPNVIREEIVLEDTECSLMSGVEKAANDNEEPCATTEMDACGEDKGLDGTDPFVKDESSVTYGINQPGSSSSKSQLFTPVLPPKEQHIVPQLHNVVATVDVSCKLNLLRIALHARNAEYNPKRFAAVIMRLRNPTTTALVFSTGKIVITGARNEDASSLAARKYARIIQKLGFDVKNVSFKIHNIVASCDVKFPIQIEKLYTNHFQFCSYEPELFPGLVFRMLRPRVALLIFVSGRIVLTGAKTRADLQEAFKNIYPTLLAFRKQ